MQKVFNSFVLITVLFMAISCSSNVNNNTTNQDQIPLPEKVTEEFSHSWTTWSSSQYLTDQNNMPPVDLSNNTLRQIIHISNSAEVIKVKFSNRVGKEALTIKEVHIANPVKQGSSKIDLSTETCLTFNGNREVTIPAGQEVYSDLVKYNLKNLQELAITIYYGKVPSTLTGHPGSRTNSFIVRNNQISAEEFSNPSKTAHWYTIAAVEGYGNSPKKSVICIGDSITDGRGSTDDKQNRWTDNFSVLLHNNPATAEVGVVNQGIGGTLLTSSCTERFDRDVLKQTGAAYVIMLYGVNDIIYINANAQTIIDCYKKLIKKAHMNGLNIYGGTILPFGKCGDYTEARNKVRVEINEWIRSTTSENGGFDAYFDFDAVMKDPSNTNALKASYDCGDGLHPSPAGYEQMITAINDLSLFTKAAYVYIPSSSDTYSAVNVVDFSYRLPVSLKKDESLTVNVKGTNNGTKGFRSWLVNDFIETKSNIYDGFVANKSDYVSGKFNITYTLIANENVNRLYFKGPVYGTNIDDVDFEEITVTIKGTDYKFNPSLDVL